jgi:hypothetical protein
MAHEPEGRLRRFLRIEPGISLVWWFYERVASVWKEIAALAGGGSLAWLGYAQHAIATWTPFHWVALFIATSLLIWLLLSLGSILRAIAYSKISSTRFMEIVAAANQLNPLRTEFRDEKINIGAFYHPFTVPNRKKSFRNCEIFGPGVVAMHGSPEIISCKFSDCDFVCVKPNTRSAAVIVFESPEFRACAFYRTTFFMLPNHLELLKAKASGPENLNVVSFEPAGNPSGPR